jgi:1-acyl-sn-glycerol-3-phosphate acyltransferase
MAKKSLPPHADHVRELETPPSVKFERVLSGLRWYFDPEFLHLERASRRRPTLFVANHSVWNVFDAMMFADALYRERGIVLRSLSDRIHFGVPLWRDLLVQQGSVLGSRENCAALMRRGENVLVFPGGAREVFKHKGEAYQLLWKERYGFVRLAIEHGYTITPYATVGAEESLDVLLDAGDYMRSPVGRYLSSTGLADRHLRGGEELPPLVRGLGVTPLPRPEKMYFVVGRPIDTRPCRGRHEDPETLRRVRDRVARQLKRLIAEGRDYRARDTRVGALRQFLNRL